MASAFITELRHQRQRAATELDWALGTGDDLLAQVAAARLQELDELAARHGEDVTA